MRGRIESALRRTDYSSIQRSRNIEQVQYHCTKASLIMLSDNCDLIILITGGDSSCITELVQHQKHKGAQFSR